MITYKNQRFLKSKNNSRSLTYKKESKNPNKLSVSKIDSEIELIKKEIKKGYDTDYASFSLVDDTKSLNEIVKFSKTYTDYSTIVVIGIGGSNLGTQTVFESIMGKNSNLLNDKKMFFADTVDSSTIKTICEILDSDIKSGKKVLVNVVSKSGGTTETIANYSVIEKVLLKNKLDLSNHVVITTNFQSKLWEFGEKEKIPCLAIPTLVGGRYSVFSSVGLFPLAAYGLNIRKLITGAKDMRDKCLKKTGNLAKNSALEIYSNYSSGKNICETFIFGNDFECLGKWYRQLMGESIGKQFNKQGKVVWNGMTPTVAMGSNDLHSMAQLYLGGPMDKYVMFILPKENSVVKIGNNKEFDTLVKGIQGKTLEQIMDAIVKGIQGAFAKQKRPFSTFKLNRTLEDIGGLLQLKMFEIVFLARLMNVNPFDQPNVEEYKIETKRFLK